MSSLVIPHNGLENLTAEVAEFFPEGAQRNLSVPLRIPRCSSAVIPPYLVNSLTTASA